MDTKTILANTKKEFDHAIEFYKSDIASIRTGRATPTLVEDIMVDAYGQKMHIKELASMSVPESRTLLIQPWDKGMLEPISGAIRKSDIGLNPIVDGEAIRLNIPSLTEERRKEFVKLLKSKTEEARIKIRQVREHCWNEIQKMEKNKEITEDDKFSSRDLLQKTVDQQNSLIEDIQSKKESELMNS